MVSLRGPGKTRIRRKHAWKAKKKSCLVPSRPFVSDQTLKQGSNLFILVEPVYAGFGLKRAGASHAELLRGVGFFLPVEISIQDTSKKRAQPVVSGAARSRAFQAKPLNTGSTECETIHPCFRVWPELLSILLSRSHLKTRRQHFKTMP